VNTPDSPAPPEPVEVRCAECGRRLAANEERIETEGGVFCQTCFANLRAAIEHAVAGQSEDISYGAAAVGGALGGAVGAAVWWGFTAATKVSFGLVAVVIGFAVGKGVQIFTGGKRSVGLQALSAGIAAVAFAYASYLVNRTFILRATAEQGQEVALPLLPDPELGLRVIALGFGIMDVVFLGIVLWQAWTMSRPIRLGG
jgi:hypothetical protein